MARVTRIKISTSSLTSALLFGGVGWGFVAENQCKMVLIIIRQRLYLSQSLILLLAEEGLEPPPTLGLLFRCSTPELLI